MDTRAAIAEDLTISVGTGASTYNGRDSSPYYVSEVLPNGVIGLYSAHWQFDDKHPWEGGVGVVDKFDSSHASELYIKRRYGNWWQCSKDGKPLCKFTDKYRRLGFNGAYAYQDPSF